MRTIGTRNVRVHLVLCLLALAMALPLLRPDSAVATVTFDWVTVGDLENLADTRVMDKGPSPDMTTGYGSVGYAYRISKHHVTNSQYTEFLNAVDPDGEAADPLFGDPNGIYNPNMSSSTIGGPGTAYTGGIDFDSVAAAGSKYSAKSGQENYPATWINWNSGARFANWLHNGQGAGDTENGVYDMSVMTDATPPRQEGATVFIPSDDEFYKAAYYDPTKGGTGGYWEYGVQSDSSPVSEGPPGGDNSANYRGPTEGSDMWQTGVPFDNDISQNYLVDVGSYSDATSYYGLYDVDGELYQWTEGTKTSIAGDELPAYRGGAWYYWSDDINLPENFIGASYRNLYSFRDAAAYHWFGLRIAGLPSVSGDFNNDESYDCLDIDALVAEIARGTNDLAFDLTSDGNVNGDDLAAWLVVGGANNSNATGGNPFLAGDANLDGTVDGADFLTWNSNKFTSTAAWCAGDFTAEGTVDGADFLIWNSNKFMSSDSDAINAVPEPSLGFAFLGLTLISCFGNRMARRRTST